MTAYLWPWMNDEQRAQALASALGHALPSVRARARMCQLAEFGVDVECVWVHHGGAKWECLAALFPVDIALGVKIAVRP